ncbi:MAG: M15 family metallopeptidase [bacterium]
MSSETHISLSRRSLITAGVLIAFWIISLVCNFYNYHHLDNARITALEKLTIANNEKVDLIIALRNERNIVNSFQGQIRDIGSAVGTLEKLSQTDTELLMKYSKVYFLNENYTPSKLSPIDKEYLYEKDRELLFHTDALFFLRSLLESAKSDKVNLLIASAFRSFDTQASLKNGYATVYGSGANQFSADQGYSEHQLGTAVDLTTSEIGASFSKFEASSAYEWLTKNAYKYGFILSYPKENTYYKFEPWHWRFVGTSLANSLHNENQNFYDLDQRQIIPYLINIFD